MTKRIFFIFILITLMTGCSMPALSLAEPSGNPSSVRSMRLVTADPNSTATPTPFQPVTSTPRPVNTVTVLPTKTASAANVIPTLGPTPAGKPAMGKYPDGQVRILVMGSDARPTGGFRTDIIMLVSINPKHGTATVLSFPRDLYINLPGWGQNRINTAMVYGGFSLMASTMESNLGVRPNHYIMTTFTGFTQIVDSLNGVDVKASQTLTDKCKFPQGVKGYCTINPGITHMNGQFALWYVRSRYSTSDFDRERRSQEVLQALFSKLMSLNAVSRIPDLYEIYKKNVETDLSLADIASLAVIAPNLISDPSRIRRYTIAPPDVYNYTVPGSGAMVEMPNDALIRQKVMEAVFTP